MEKSFYKSPRNIFYILFSLLFVFSASQMAAQTWPGAPGGGSPGGGQQMNIGRFYGKVVDEKNKGVGYATVEIYGMQFDTLTKTMKERQITGQITADNGDFSLEKLPIVGDFTLKVSFIGYAEIRRPVSFGIKPPTGAPGTAPGGGMPGGIGAGANFDKDLGNIKLVVEGTTLSEVTVTAQASQTTLALDKKVYRVDKDASTAGGNAQDALKNVPSLSVDIDGNVSLRNGAPQIFVDGRPTTLSLDQISADAIESVEVITNPSAKFDAGGGTAGIINIVLKKEKKLGYNGNVRAGTDTRTGFNGGGDINARATKTNLFLSGSFNRMKGFSDGETYRDNFATDLFPRVYTSQITDNTMEGYFANGRAGFDWFMDNRNTLTLSGSLTRGHFEPFDQLTVRQDTFLDGSTPFSEYVRNSMQDRNFRNLGTSVQFKHLFPKDGAEWTADVNYNRTKFFGESNYTTDYEGGTQSRERQKNEGNGSFLTLQTDFINPLNKQMKLEGGLRASMRNNKNDQENSFLKDGVWENVYSLADHYKFNDDVFAAYGQFSHQFPTWGYQVGLRAESSVYKGELTDRDSSFTIGYPLSLFPSIFVTKKLNDTDNIQIAYTRRVNRPNFFQTMPFIDFSDSLNLRRGNPELLPEFMNSMELSYQKIFAKGHNVLMSVYYKRASNLITTQIEPEYNEDLGRTVNVASYINANSSQAYGAEATLKSNIFKVIDLTTNVNVYQSNVDATNVQAGLEIDQFSWFVKENIQVKLPAGFSLQVSGEYRSRASFTPDSGNRMPWQAGPTNTAQGYSLENWFVDAALRKEVLNKKGTITLNVNDIFKTRRNGTYTESAFFTQELYRYRDPQIFRLNFSYRFGKMDTSLFKRKNMKMNMQGNDMMG